MAISSTITTIAVMATTMSMSIKFTSALGNGIKFVSFALGNGAKLVPFSYENGVEPV